MIYWADGGTNQIEKAHLDGSGRSVIHADRAAHYFGLALFNSQTLYYTDWTQRSVRDSLACFPFSFN